MAFATGQQITDEVYFRIGGRLTTAQIVPYVNSSLALMAAAGSFKWEQVEVSGGTTSVGLWSPSPSYPLDPGKKVSIFNSTSGSPIAMIHTDDIALASKGYVDQLGPSAEFNAFRISYIPGTGAYLQCYPTTATGKVDVIYHVLPPTLAYAATPTVLWDTPWMNDILVDYTEALLSRIFKWTGYQELEANAKSRLIEAAKDYSTERINTGPLEEAATAEQEKQTVGRV